jgi:hypothetical protein
LRRALKFKAYIFLIAWATIFAHNLIPHNHADASLTLCSGLIHFHGTLQSEGDRSTKLNNEHSDSKVCHFSNFLYQNLSPEVLLAGSCRDINFNPENQGAKFYSDGEHFYITDHLKDNPCLRAPPALS